MKKITAYFQRARRKRESDKLAYQHLVKNFLDQIDRGEIEFEQVDDDHYSAYNDDSGQVIGLHDGVVPRLVIAWGEESVVHSLHGKSGRMLTRSIMKSAKRSIY